jgi:hypothetical protein
MGLGVIVYLLHAKLISKRRWPNTILSYMGEKHEQRRWKRYGPCDEVYERNKLCVVTVGMRARSVIKEAFESHFTCPA